MNKAILGTLLGIVMLSIPLAVSAAPQVYQLTVDGLACPFCAYGIEKQLSALEGVESIEVEIDEGLVVVTMTEGATLDRADMDQAVMDAGFTLRGRLVVSRCHRRRTGRPARPP